MIIILFNFRGFKLVTFYSFRERTTVSGPFLPMHQVIMKRKSETTEGGRTKKELLFSFEKNEFLNMCRVKRYRNKRVEINVTIAKCLSPFLISYERKKHVTISTPHFPFLASRFLSSMVCVSPCHETSTNLFTPFQIYPIVPHISLLSFFESIWE